MLIKEETTSHLGANCGGGYCFFNQIPRAIMAPDYISRNRLIHSCRVFVLIRFGHLPCEKSFLLKDQGFVRLRGALHLQPFCFRLGIEPDRKVETGFLQTHSLFDSILFDFTVFVNELLMTPQDHLILCLWIFMFVFFFNLQITVMNLIFCLEL